MGIANLIVHINELIDAQAVLVLAGRNIPSLAKGSKYKVWLADLCRRVLVRLS
jgi:hypothetical protein